MNRFENMNIKELREEVEYHNVILETAENIIAQCAKRNDVSSMRLNKALRNQRIAERCISQIKNELMFA